MALNFADPQVKRIITKNSTSLTLSEVFSILELAELLEEAIKFNYLLKEVYNFKQIENELKIELPSSITVILTADGILKIPTDEEYIEIICRTDHIFDFLKKVQFSLKYANDSISSEEKAKNFEKNREAFCNFSSFRFHIQQEYMLKNPVRV